MNELDIKKIREELGLTQAEFAKKIGVDPRTVQRWELGETQIPTAKKHLFRTFLNNAQSDQANVNGDNIKGTDVKVHYNEAGAMTAIDKAIDEIAAQRRITEKSQGQLTKAQEQIDRLIALLERK